jgi:hypothetical protein
MPEKSEMNNGFRLSAFPKKSFEPLSRLKPRNGVAGRNLRLSHPLHPGKGNWQGKSKSLIKNFLVIVLFNISIVTKASSLLAHLNSLSNESPSAFQLP